MQTPIESRKNKIGKHSETLTDFESKDSNDTICTRHRDFVNEIV